MNFTLRFDSKDRVLLVTLGKVVTEAIVREIHPVVVRFVDAQGPCSLIGDFTAVESSELSAQSMRALAEMIPAIPDTPGSLRVFIAPRAAIYGLIRMFQIHQTDCIGLAVVLTLLQGAEHAVTVNPIRFSCLRAERIGPIPRANRTNKSCLPC